MLSDPSTFVPGSQAKLFSNPGPVTKTFNPHFNHNCVLQALTQKGLFGAFDAAVRHALRPKVMPRRKRGGLRGACALL